MCVLIYVHSEMSVTIECTRDLEKQLPIISEIRKNVARGEKMSVQFYQFLSTFNYLSQCADVKIIQSYIGPYIQLLRESDDVTVRPPPTPKKGTKKEIPPTPVFENAS